MPSRLLPDPIQVNRRRRPPVITSPATNFKTLFHPWSSVVNPSHQPNGVTVFSTATIRKSIWATVPFNLLGATAFAFPQSFPGRLLQVPDAPAVHAFLLGFIILTFGLMYLWIALQPEINRPLLAFGAVGKVGVFLIGLALFIVGRAPFMMAFGLLGDLAFGSLWLVWLRSTK